MTIFMMVYMIICMMLYMLHDYLHDVLHEDLHVYLEDSLNDYLRNVLQYRRLHVILVYRLSTKIGNGFLLCRKKRNSITRIKLKKGLNAPSLLPNSRDLVPAENIWMPTRIEVKLVGKLLIVGFPVAGLLCPHRKFVHSFL